MKYTLQIDGTHPKNWREIEAEDPCDAIVKAIRPLIADGHNPEKAYIVMGKSRHPNGSPICVEGYSLTVNRDAK